MFDVQRSQSQFLDSPVLSLSKGNSESPQPALLTGCRREAGEEAVYARPATLRARLWRPSGQAEAKVEDGSS